MAFVAMRRSMAISSNRVSAQTGETVGQTGASAAKGVLMAGVDHGRQHVRADFTTPHCGANSVFQRLNARAFGGAGLQTIDPIAFALG